MCCCSGFLQWFCGSHVLDPLADDVLGYVVERQLSRVDPAGPAGCFFDFDGFPYRKKTLLAKLAVARTGNFTRVGTKCVRVNRAVKMDTQLQNFGISIDIKSADSRGTIAGAEAGLKFDVDMERGISAEVHLQIQNELTKGDGTLYVEFLFPMLHFEVELPDSLSNTDKDIVVETIAGARIRGTIKASGARTQSAGLDVSTSATPTMALFGIPIPSFGIRLGGTTTRTGAGYTCSLEAFGGPPVDGLCSRNSGTIDDILNHLNKNWVAKVRERPETWKTMRIRVLNPSHGRPRPQPAECADPQPPTDADTYAKKLHYVCMAGKTGAGKSATACILVGSDRFEIGERLGSQTRECSFADVHVTTCFGEKDFRVIDTIGMADTKLEPEQVLEKFAQFADNTPYGIDSFLYIQPWVRFTKEEDQGFEFFELVCGKDVWAHTSLIFTKVNNDWTDRECFDNLEKDCQDNSRLKNRVDLVGSRILFLRRDLGSSAKKKNQDAIMQFVLKNKKSQRFTAKGFLEEAMEWRNNMNIRIADLADDVHRQAMRECMMRVLTGDGTRKSAEEKLISAQETEAKQRAAEERARQAAAEAQRQEQLRLQQKHEHEEALRQAAAKAKRVAEERAQKAAADARRQEEIRQEGIRLQQKREHDEALQRAAAAQRAAEERARQAAAEAQRQEQVRLQQKREHDEAIRRAAAAQRAAEERARQAAAARQQEEFQAQLRRQKEEADRLRRQQEEEERRRKIIAEEARPPKTRVEGSNTVKCEGFFVCGGRTVAYHAPSGWRIINHSPVFKTSFSGDTSQPWTSFVSSGTGQPTRTTDYFVEYYFEKHDGWRTDFFGKIHVTLEEIRY